MVFIVECSLTWVGTEPDAPATCRFLSCCCVLAQEGLLWFGGFPLLSPPLPLVGVICLLPPGRETEKPLGQTVPCLLIPPANRNAISQRSTGCTGQAEMPDCLGVPPPRQVVPGLHLVFICLLVVEFVFISLFLFLC